ncbi:Lamin-like protein [Linum grandiflorum]
MVIRLTVAMFMFLLAITAQGRDPVLYRVGGGRYSWIPGTNFTTWASQQHFYVGDWLYFGFNKTLYNVLEVNKTSYDQCRGEDFIANITRGGRDVFNLTERKPYYFICSRSTHCSLRGMKVEVLVTDLPLPLQAMTTSSSSPPPRLTTTAISSAILLLLCSIQLLYLLSYRF